MKINNLQIFKINNKNNDNNSHVKRFGVSCPNLAPLKQDTVSFKGNVLKKSDFKGVDLAVVERYKPNIQQFKSKEDLQTFAENKIKELFINQENFQDGKTLKQVQGDNLKDFGGRQEETKVQRKAMLKEWFDYVIKENDAYSNTQRLVILSAITKDLKLNNDIIPPVLNKGVLAQTVTELEEKLKANPKENFDFNKIYKNNLRIVVLDNISRAETMTGWVVIPSKENDSENFEKNVEKLKTLSHNNWCTKSFNAKPYLSEGDFHVYLENGQPKLGVRFVGDNVREFQGPLNNGKIPLRYLNEIKSRISDQNFILSKGANNQVIKAEDGVKELSKLKAKLKVTKIETIDDAIHVFNALGCKPKKLDDGSLCLENYFLPSRDISCSDLGINEEALLNYVSRIEMSAIFCNSELSKLSNIKYIGEHLDMQYSQIKSLGNLEYIGGSAMCQGSKLEDLGALKQVGYELNLNDTQIKSLKNLESVGLSLALIGTPCDDLGNLKNVRFNAYIKDSKLNITDFKNVKLKCVYS